MDSSSRDDRSIRETVAATLADHPVSVGFIFGSQARGEAHDQSDIDVAVAFEDTDPGEPGHMDARLALGSELALALGTDDVDVVDLQSASPSLVRAVFREGDRLAGSKDDARRLRKVLLDDIEIDNRSPAERFDEALTAIDDHLA